MKTAEGTELPGFVWHYVSLPAYPWEGGFDEGKRDKIPQHGPADFKFNDNCHCGNYLLVTPGNQQRR